ncbi:hypothetical protein BFG51_16660 [Dietzia alimentaria]|nr:hypothetical protein BFG51_16660 [Dietzia alimentaria]
MAGAQDSIPWRTDSPSSVSIERVVGGDLIVSYDNQSGFDLGCYSYVGPRAMVQALYDAHVTSGLVEDGPQLPPGAEDEISDAVAAGQWASGFFGSEVGESGPVTFLDFDEDAGGTPLAPVIHGDLRIAGRK